MPLRAACTVSVICTFEMCFASETRLEAGVGRIWTVQKQKVVGNVSVAACCTDSVFALPRLA